MQQNEFQHIPATFWVYILLPFTVIAVTLVGIRTHNPFIFALIGVIPFCFLLMNRIDFWLITIFAIYNSRLRIPGVLGQLELVDIMIAGLAGVVFLRWIIVKNSAFHKALMWKFIYMFGVVLLLTIVVRGTGFRFLGDVKWGGMRYVELLLAMLFPFVVTNLSLTPKQWRTAIVAMSLLALIPVIADVVFIVSNGVVYHQYYLIKHGVVQEAFQTFGTGQMTRFKSAAAGGAAIVVLPFILFPPVARNFWKYALLVLTGLAFTSMAGFRLGIINVAAFIGVYAFVVFKRHRMAVVIISLLTGLVATCMLILLMPHLPLSIQRAFSFLPFAHVDPGVAMSASGTTEWRLMVWKNALTEIPEYWKLGKGFTYDPQVLASLTENASPTDWARIQVAYHNGVLSLLIGMGLAGLIAGVGILLTATIRHYRIFMSEWHDSALQRFHGVFLALLLVQSFVYLTAYGDVFASFPGIFKLVAILEGLNLANRAIAGVARDSGSEPDTVASPASSKTLRVSPF